MDSQYKRQASCPNDETLLAYKTKGLAGRERDAVVFHLLFCEACMEVLHQLPTEIDKEVESEDQGISEIEANATISSKLAEAIEQFTQQEERRRERPLKTLQQVLQEGGLKLGQIWRTRFDNVTVPDGENEDPVSVTDLDSTPHLVVVIESAAGTKSSHGNYQIIQIAPISAETENASEGDLLVTEEESPLGYSFMIELWNEQSMLQENLDSCLAIFDPVEHKKVFEKLQQEREKLQRTGEKPLTLEQTVMKGLYHNPIMRFRAHEYEETAYLRAPVEALAEMYMVGESDNEPSQIRPGHRLKCRLVQFRRLPSLAAPIDVSSVEEKRLAANSDTASLIIERELLRQEGDETNVVGTAEQRGLNVVIHLPNQYAGQLVSLCERKSGFENIIASKRTDEGGWVSFDLSDPELKSILYGEVGHDYFLVLDSQPKSPLLSIDSDQSEGISLRKFAHGIKRFDRDESTRALLTVLSEGDAIDRDDTYDQLLQIVQDRVPGHPLFDQIVECLTAKPENDPHLTMKREKVRDALTTGSKSD